MAKQESKKEQENDKTENKKGFGVFIQKTLSNIISILIWVLLGSNFMYYANRFAPKDYGGTNIQCPPYNKPGVLTRDCLPSKKQKESSNKEKATNFFTDLSEWGWPYNNAMTQNPESNIKPKPKKPVETGLIADIKEVASNTYNIITGTSENPKPEDKLKWNPFKWFIYWITQTIAFSYATGRSILSKVISLFNTGENIGWRNTIGVLGTPFIVVFIVTILAPIIGFLATLWGAFVHPFTIDGFPFLKAWWKIILWFLFLIILCFTPLSPFFIAAATTGWQHIQLVVLFAFLPLIYQEGRKYVWERLKNNWILISCMMLLFTTANAWTYLGKDVGLGFLITTLMVVGYFIFTWAFGSKTKT